MTFPSTHDTHSSNKIPFATTGPTDHLLENFNDISSPNSIHAINSIKKNLTNDVITTSTIQKLSYLFCLRTIDGLKSAVDSRIRLITLRFKCLFILLSSRLPYTRIQSFLNPNCIFLKDMLSLSDISSEVISYLSPSCILSLSHLALNCTVGVLKLAHKRKGPFLNIRIDRNLGLVPVHTSRQSLWTYDNLGGSHEILWISIVISACSSLSSSMVDAIQLIKSSGHSTINVNSPYQSFAESDISSGIYAKAAYELLGTCLSMSDSYDLRGSTALVGAITALGQTFTGYLNHLFSNSTSSASSHSSITTETTKTKGTGIMLSWDDQQAMWAVGKSLSCLDLTLSQPGSLEAVAESHSLSIISSIIEAFATNSVLSHSRVDLSALSVLQKSINLLSRLIGEDRRGSTLNSESGLQVLGQPFFSKLCEEAFQHPSNRMNFIWYQLFGLFRAAIRTEPAFLGQFLKTSYANMLKTLFNASLIDSLIDEDSETNLEMILYALCRFCHELCLTADGQTYLQESKIADFVINSVTNPRLIYPNSSGFRTDTISRCGACLSWIIKDCNSLRPLIILILQDELLLRSHFDSTEEKTPMEMAQSLESLLNICILVENMTIGSDRRMPQRKYDVIREILTPDVLTSLVKSYIYTLPASNQLLAQTSIRHVPGTIPSYGHHALSKVLTSLINISLEVSTVVVPILFKSINDALLNISSAKTSLIEFVKSSKTLNSKYEMTESLKNPSKKGFKPIEIERETFIKKPNPISLDLNILGILDFIPHTCFFDIPSSTSEPSHLQQYVLTESEQILNYASNLMSSILTLDWLSNQLLNAFKAIQKQPSHLSNLTGTIRDTIRQVFAYNRITLLEVCRFSATKQSSKVRLVLYIFFLLISRYLIL